LIQPTVEAFARSARRNGDALELQTLPDCRRTSARDWLRAARRSRGDQRENKRRARRLRERGAPARRVEDVDYPRPSRPRPRPCSASSQDANGSARHPPLVRSAPTASASRGLTCALGQKACREGPSRYSTSGPSAHCSPNRARPRGEAGCAASDDRARTHPALIIDDWDRKR